MNNKFLGRIALAASPFLFIDFIINGGGKKEEYHHSFLGALCNFIYMTGWICSIIGLYRLRAMGKSKAAQIVVAIQLLFLILAEAWNVYEAISPGANTSLYLFLDMFWPISNCFMLITGIAVVFGKKLKGSGRFIPLFVGLWLPLSVLFVTLTGESKPLFFMMGMYTFIAWSLMGNLVRQSGMQSMMQQKIA